MNGRILLLARFSRTPEFTKMSLKPGIAEGWLKKFMSDVYPNDYVVVNGRKCKPPRYYDRKLSELTEDFYFNMAGDKVVFSDFDDIQMARELNFLDHLEDNTPERLSTKEQVTQARVDRLKRSLK